MKEYEDNFYKRLKNLILCNINEKFFFKKLNLKFPKNIFRWKIIQTIIKKKKYTSYLEIGCDDNSVFSKINIKNKVGVDPKKGGNFRGTSDFFFKQNKKKFDCIFIDGLHEFNQVLKDVKNSIKILNNDGIILLHDTMPRNKYHQAVPRCRPTWNGDVWKAVVYFRSFSNLVVATLEIDQGITLIKKRRNLYKLNYKKKDCRNLKFKDYFYNYKTYLNLKNKKFINSFI